MSRKTEQINTSMARKQLRKLAGKLIEDFDSKKSVLANAFGIKGMGKDHLLALLADNLDSRNIQHPKIINIPESPDSTEVLNVSKQTADWVYSEILKSKEKVSRDMDGLEKDYFSLRGKLSEKKDKPSFAVLVNDIHNLPFDDLDWFQSVVLEALVSTSGSIVVVTSQNELNWHSWEMRNKCESIELEVFSSEEIQALCESQPLAQKIEELSAGHPKTAQALVDAAGKKKALSSIAEEDINALNKEFYTILKDEIDDSLSLNDKNGWLGEVFYLVSAADGFDADLVSDIASAFNISTPEDATDIAWEMAYTGLAYWDFDAKTYKIVPELRKRMAQYVLRNKEKYIKILQVLSTSYRKRSRLLPNEKELLFLSNKYLAEAKKLENTTDGILPLFSTPNEKNTPLKKIRGTMNAQREALLDTSEFRRKEIALFQELLAGNLQKSVLCYKGDAGFGKTVLLNNLFSLASKNNYPTILIDLHYRRHRRPTIFLQEVISQLGLTDNSINVLKKKLSSPREYFSAASPSDAYEHVLREAVDIVSSAFHLISKKKKRQIVILIDTFDYDSSITAFSNWLFSKFLPKLGNTFLLVITGRRNFQQEKKSLEQDFEIVELKGLRSFEIKKIADLFIDNSGMTSQFRDKLVNLSAGNPLVASWISFYLTQIRGDVKDIFEWQSKDIALNDVAKNTWASNNNPAMTQAFLAATHFGSHFTLDLFENVVSQTSLGGISHARLLNNLRKFFPTYGRSTKLSWTLHDEVRERMLINLKKNRINGSNYEVALKNLSIRAIQYYTTKIDDLEQRKKKTGLTPDEQADLYDYKSERIYHQIYCNSENFHLELWNYLDELWHQYRLEEMTQVIQYARDVQERSGIAKEDSLLTNLLNAADAWLHYTREQFELAEDYATLVLASNPPRRLRATALAVLGRLPYTPPVVATARLDEAHKLYKSLLESIQRKKLREFCDSKSDVLQEIHMVLIQLGRIHLLHYFNLEEGLSALRKAYQIATSDEWNDLLYAAIALNEIARYQRFQGQFDEALDNVMQAISIYQKKGKSLSSRTNLANFFTTLGLIKKEKEDYGGALDEFKKAIDIYENIPGISETHKSNVILEIGDIYELQGKNDLAKSHLYQALEVFESKKETHRWFFLSTLVKLGKMYRSSNLTLARKYFVMAKDFAEERGYDLWAYWANYHLAEIGFLKSGKINKLALDKLMSKYKKRNLGPAFWATKSLVFKYYKLQGKIDFAFTEYAKGLSYLVYDWKYLFNKNLDGLREEFIEIDTEKRATAAKAVKGFWSKRFKSKNPSPRLARICEQVIQIEKS